MPLSAPVIPHRGTESIWAPICPARLPREPQRGKGGGDVNGRGLWGSRRPLWAGGLWGGTRGARGVVPVTPKTLGSLGAGGGSVGWFPRTPSAGGVYGVAPQNPGTPGVGGGLWGGPQNSGTPGVGGSVGWPLDLFLPFRATCVRGSPDSNQDPQRRGKEVGSAAFERGRTLAPGCLGPPSAPKGRGVGMGPNADTGHP